MEIKKITAAETYALRHKVLWPHLASEENCSMEGDEHFDTFHLGAFNEESKLVSIGSFLSDSHPEFGDNNQFRLRAMASDSNYKGSGFGSALLNEAFVILNNVGVSILWCDARLVAVPFYEKLGFIKIGEPYEKPNIGAHYLMYREL